MHKDDEMYNENVELKSNLDKAKDEINLLKNKFEKVTDENNYDDVDKNEEKI